MLDVVLYQPEIPPNTGNVIRLCANAGARLHLVQPLGFSLDDRNLRRAGMDYRERAAVVLHDDWNACRSALGAARQFAITTRGSARYDQTRFEPGDAFIFGPETRGLPDEMLATFTASKRLRIPMAAQSRSLNLANSVAVITFEAWRQCGFSGAAETA